MKEQGSWDVSKYSFSQRNINLWNNLSADCVHASCVNVHEQNRQVSCKGWYMWTLDKPKACLSGDI